MFAAHFCASGSFQSVISAVSLRIHAYPYGRSNAAAPFR